VIQLHTGGDLTSGALRRRPRCLRKSPYGSYRNHCSSSRLPADPARRNIAKPRFHLTTRPFLAQHDRPALVEADDVERVLADIDADHCDRGVEFQRQSVLVCLDTPSLALLADGAGARPDHPISCYAANRYSITSSARRRVAAGALQFDCRRGALSGSAVHP
jgi:hypothetical protein